MSQLYKKEGHNQKIFAVYVLQLLCHNVRLKNCNDLLPYFILEKTSGPHALHHQAQAMSHHSRLLLTHHTIPHSAKKGQRYCLWFHEISRNGGASGVTLETGGILISFLRMCHNIKVPSAATLKTWLPFPHHHMENGTHRSADTTDRPPVPDWNTPDTHLYPVF